MLQTVEWEALLGTYEQVTRETKAETFQEKGSSASSPVRAGCADGCTYYLKGAQTDRTPYNEQLVACLAHQLGAPVPPIRIVELTAELREIEVGMQHLLAGPLHGSRVEDRCTDREALRYYDQAENRPRFASLALLYTWMGAADYQFIYHKQPPNLVFSVDHGHFFSGPNWSVDTLAAAPAITQIDAHFAAVGLTPDELGPWFDRLEKITVVHIAAAAARPPDVWGATVEERIAMCTYLEKRQAEALSLR